LVPRALRVLLTCIALALALPLANGASQADLSAYVTAVPRSSEAPCLVRAHIVPTRPNSYPSAVVERKPARAKVLPSALFGARRTFLINCSLLC